jgi:hypothetical protein
MKQLSDQEYYQLIGELTVLKQELAAAKQETAEWKKKHDDVERRYNESLWEDEHRRHSR